ncbi:MAG: ABC transporter substrate-binding protein [Acidimicrobiia bacterium]|nr:ABC transporter substrate-binding protein [Acidimicrobiia bacterium]
MRDRIRSGAVGAMLVVLALVASACGDDASGGGTKEGPTITVGSFNFGESLILAEIYAQVLEANGYPVSRTFNLGSRELVYPALVDGDIDLLPEYTGSLLTHRGGVPVPDEDETYAAMVAAISADGLLALDYAPAQDKNGIVVTGATAASLGLSKVSDLAAHNGTLAFGGPPECPQRELCLLGLEQVYGLEFASFSPLDVGGPLTVAALEGGEIDVALLFTSDGVIAAKGFVLLEDDMGLQPAENVVPVTTDEIVAAYGNEFVDLLDSVSAKLTTAALSELNKRYGIDAEDADALATEWLADNGFLG